MKNIVKKFNKLIWIVPIVVATLYSSCKKQDNGGTGAPKITRIAVYAKTDTIPGVVHRIDLTTNQTYDDTRVVPFDSTVTLGRVNNSYVIIGENLKTTKSISFNGKDVYFNPTLVTDKSVLVSTGEFVPYGPTANNQLVLTTNYGSVSYTFPIQQPSPNIVTFAPVVAGAGDIVTITGMVFENLVSVKFDNIPAEIVGTPTKTEIKVKVPANISQAFLYVQTAGGIAKSLSPFGFKALVYGDGYSTAWSSTGYNSLTTEVSTNVKRGTLALRCDYTGGYGAYRAGYNGATINVAAAGITAIKLSIFGGPGSEGKKVNISLNDTYADGKRVTLFLTEGKYTDYIIPLSALGNPETLKEIILQEFSGFSPSTIYIDDLGFI